MFNGLKRKKNCTSSGTGSHTAHAGSFQNFLLLLLLLLIVLRLVSRVVFYLGLSVTRSDAVRCFSLHLFLGCFRTFESVLKTLLGTAKTIFLHVENIFTFSVLHVLGTFQHEVPMYSWGWKSFGTLLIFITSLCMLQRASRLGALKVRWMSFSMLQIIVPISVLQMNFHCTVAVAAGYPVVPSLCLKNYQIVFADGARDELISFVELIISSKFVLAFGIVGWLMNGNSKCIVIIINNLLAAGWHVQTFWFQHSPSFGWGSLIWLYFIIIVFINARASLVTSHWWFLFLQLSE